MKTQRRQRGMSLIEIMVGVLIGLIGCVVIFQMYSVADARKRTIASGSDMDITGRLGLMSLERDLQLAGYGFGMAASPTATLGGTALGCNVA
ncbi:MAG TPA: prepilin-type N-terminal cleavage/methylation domain-containing protein, partial [Mizugakiibacter sp.]